MFKGKKIKQQSFKIIVNIRKSLEQDLPMAFQNTNANADLWVVDTKNG